MPFTLGQKSSDNLIDVNLARRSVVQRAITLTAQDFGVYEGLRTLERQKKLVASGAAKTLASMHIADANGIGHAVDLVPYVDGQLRWEWGPIFHIAAAVGQAATELGFAHELCWGGVWDRWLDSYAGDAAAMKAAVNAYTDRRRALGRTAFIDGPHFQIGRLG